ncbi:MAG: OmpA family protein [Campylobacter sp.]
MKKIAIALVVATAVFGANQDYNYEITPTIGGVHPEGNLGTNEQISVGLRVARNLEDFLIDQLEVGFNHTSNIKEFGEKGKAQRYFVNAIKGFGLTDDLSVYGLVGAGFEDVSARFVDNDDDVFGQYGLGLKYQVADNFALRAEATDSIKFDHGNHNLHYTLGFAVAFDSKKMAPVTQPAPMVAPEKPAVVVDLDDDKDGVLNDADKCPNTPAGVVVDETGCEKVIILRDLGVNFAFDSYQVSSSYLEEIKKVAVFMNEHSDYRVVLEGHTDSVGNDAYNQKLSEKRANAVAKALKDLGVSASKITTVGYGETKPIADNKTKEGRAENRRVEARFNK